MMMHKFQNGTIVDFEAGERLKNNDLYILDPVMRKIRKPRNSDEWLTCQLVYVNNISLNNTIDFYIDEGEMCRCWIGYLLI